MHISSRPLLVGIAWLVAAPLQAADWKQEFAPYVWGSGMDGTVGVADLTGRVDVSFGDILDNLEMGFMGAYRVSNEQWAFTLDAIYMGLGAHGRGPGELVHADIDLDQFGFSTDAAYAVTEHLSVLGGFRYNEMSVRLKATGPLQTRHADLRQNWTDPLVGAAYTTPFADKWTFTLRGDVGGFGVGSDLAWQAVTTLRWQASPRFGLVGAYRYLDQDYEDGKGRHYFKYDMAVSGPALGVVFTF